MKYAIWQKKVIRGLDFREEIWSLYDAAFSILNEQSPIAQTFAKKTFMRFLTNPKIIKMLAIDGEGSVVGFLILTEDLTIEPMVSTAYFSKNYPDYHVFYIPAIAVKEDARASGIARRLLQAMYNYVPENSIGVFLHSKNSNPLIPKLGELMGRGFIEGEEVDAEICCIYRWRDGKRTFD